MAISPLNPLIWRAHSAWSYPDRPRLPSLWPGRAPLFHITGPRDSATAPALLPRAARRIACCRSRARVSVLSRRSKLGGTEEERRPERISSRVNLPALPRLTMVSSLPGRRHRRCCTLLLQRGPVGSVGQWRWRRNSWCRWPGRRAGSSAGFLRLHGCWLLLLLQLWLMYWWMDNWTLSSFQSKPWGSRLDNMRSSSKVAEIDYKCIWYIGEASKARASD
jgi:hypothetical protein